MRKKTLSLLLMLLLVSSLCLSVSAHEVPDFSRRGSISIVMTYRGDPVAGGSLTIYRVADVVEYDGNYGFAYTDEFANSSIPITELNSANLPRELERIASEQKLDGITQNLSNRGETTFSDLEIGLYLVVQNRAAPGFEKINPFLVSVPYNDSGRYVYDVDTEPKNIPEPETEPTKPTDPTEPDDDLPQTGQTNWPIPVLTVGGMVLVVAGFCLRASKKEDKYEA